MAPTIRRRNIFFEEMWVSMWRRSAETMIVNGKCACILGRSQRCPYPAKFSLPSGTREMVADFRILRGNHRAVCVCRSGADCVAFVPAFIARAELDR